MSALQKFVKLFGKSKTVIIGMIHLRALPGSPGAKFKLSEIVDNACKEAEIYKKANVDAIILENIHDIPWLRAEQLGPETVASMTVACQAVKNITPYLPVGVQVLRGGNKQALAIAKATGLNFIRAEGYVFSHIGDVGPVESCAAELMRYRKQIDAEDIQIFTDIKKKHCSHMITNDVSITETAKAAAMFMSDGVVISGVATGSPTDTEEVTDVQKAVTIPVLVGSGVTDKNLPDYLSANAIIIGSHFKVHGKWNRELDSSKVKHFMAKVHKLRKEMAKTTDDEKDHFAPHMHSQGE